MPVDKVFYNEASASKLGWSPDWFGCSDFDDRLVRAIRKWQKANDLAADGMCGPSSFRRIFAERAAEEEYVPSQAPSASGNSIIYNGEKYPIDWDKVILWTDNDDYAAPRGTYSSYDGKPNRDIKMFVVHWDVTTSSKTTARVLKRRGISVTFCISAAGDVIQCCDMQHATWHAGSRKWNHSSVGVEINNAFSLKYNQWYQDHGFGKRPIWQGKVHGKTLKPHLGFYPIQVQALKALIKAIHNATGGKMPLEAPDTDTVHPPAAKNKWRGVLHHFNLTKRKIDSAGLDLVKLVKELQ